MSEKISERELEDMADRVLEDIILDCKFLIFQNFERRHKYKYIYILNITIFKRSWNIHLKQRLKNTKYIRIKIKYSL